MLSSNIVLGAFIKIPIQYEYYEREIRTCGEHVDNNNNKYCPICGKEIITQKIPAKSKQRCEELVGNQNFYNYFENEYMYLFSNYSYNFYKIVTSENILTTITPGLISEVIAEFKKRHEDDILLLESKINSKVLVEFGFVNIVD